jgi:hypothetical protein
LWLVVWLVGCCGWLVGCTLHNVLLLRIFHLYLDAIVAEVTKTLSLPR